jgi:regulator of RNase E activity RraA
MPDTLPADLLAALQAIDSPTLSNAIEHFEVRDRAAGYADLRLRCQFPDYSPMVGFAVTCTADTTSPGESRAPAFDKVLRAVDEAPKPAVVVVQHVGADRQKSCFFGDMSSACLQRLGAAGVVTDGANRDRKGIAERAPGFQVFSPGWVVSHGRGAFLDIGVHVSVCGLNIAPGDLLHGDENGLMVVPQDIIKPLIEKAREVQDAEKEYFDFVEGDTFGLEQLIKKFTSHPPEN